MQRGKRIDPLTGVCCARQTTSLVPGRDRQGQENFVLHQLGHIQFACHRQEITGVVFQLFLRQFGICGDQLQQAVDIELKMDRFQATLTGQRDDPAHFQTQQGLPAFALEPFDPERDLSGPYRQHILQTFKAGNRQRSLQNTAFSSKRETIRNPFQS